LTEDRPNEIEIIEEPEILSGIINAVPFEPFVVNSSTKVHLTLRNISETPGLRVRFHTEDYVNPTSIDVDIPPGSEKLVAVNVVPLAKGERECLVEFAPLYDKNGNLIPGKAADPIVVNRFSYKARDALTGGLTSTQRRVLSDILKIASLTLVFAGILIAAVPGLQNVTWLQDLLNGEFITAFLCVILILQIPILGIYFYLMNRMPQA
jgi:hypothetical protein